MKYLMVINPISGQGVAKATAGKLEKYFQDQGLDYELCFTKYQGEGTEIVSRIRKDDGIVVVSVGGDGTVYEVINGINDGVELIVIPTGSGNDFYRLISGNREYDALKLLEDSIKGLVVQIDLVKAVRDGVEYRYVNTASAGFDAKINRTASAYLRSGRFNRKMSYTMGIVTNLLKSSSYDLRIKLDGHLLERRALLLTMMNGQYYGNGINSTPWSNIQDGLLEVVMIGELSFVSLVKALLKYRVGKTKSIKGIEAYSVRRVEFSCNEEVVIQLDGETMSCREFKAEVLPGVLSLRVPDYACNVR